MSNLIYPTPATLPGQEIRYTRDQLDDIKTQTSLGGQEVRYTWSTYARYLWTLSYELLRFSAAKLEFQRLYGFFTRHRGSWDSFLFTDPEDNSVTAHYFGVGTGSRQDYQLQRTLTPDADLAAAASRSYWTTPGDGYEPIFELNGGIFVYKNGVLQTLGADYTLPGSGTVHFAVAPLNGDLLSWTGSYYYRVRFYTDRLAADRQFQTMWEAKQVQLLTVKP